MRGVKVTRAVPEKHIINFFWPNLWNTVIVLLINHKFCLFLIPDSHEYEKKVCLSHDGSMLYVIDRQKNGDLFKKYDLNNAATLVETIQLKMMDVKSIQLVAKDK